MSTEALVTGFTKKDNSTKLNAHWQVDAYYGDIVREALPLKQQMWNLWADLKWKALGLTSEIYYRGAILNAKAYETEGWNLIVTSGKQTMLDRLFGLSAVAAVSRIGVGTNATAAAVGDTALTGSFFKVFNSTPTRSSLTVTCITTFGTGDANLNWQELGMDNGTTLLNRIAPIGPFNKTSAVSIVVTVQLTQS